MSDIHRSDERLPFISTCLLDINGNKISCIIDNISSEGALIEVSDSDQSSLHTGEIGILKALLLSPVEYFCRIIRISSNKIGLKFIGQKQ
jgi:hypothetical protein